MNQHSKSNIQSALDAASRLPQPQQDALAEEIFARISELENSSLTEEQQAEVAKRLAEPPEYADPEVVKAFFARHGVAV